MGDTFHAGVGVFERGNGSCPSNFRTFSDIIETEYVTGDENITSFKQQVFCKVNCQTCQCMSKENIHYPGHLVQYSMCNYEIESFNKYTVMLSDLEKVGGLS